MKICIAGYNGNMAARYKAVLTYLGHEHCGYDVGDPIPEADGYIIATPTHTHKAQVFALARFGKPVLCEKPVAKSMADLHHIRAVCEGHGTPFQVVMQYAYLADASRSGRSHYDYFKHGSDGLLWDCFQIIALAKERVTLCESSPVWQCIINGKKLNLAEMDMAYCVMIAEWLKDPKAQTWRYIETAHQKVIDYASSN